MKAGWRKERLEDVCREITDGSHFSPKTTGRGYSYITVRDIDNDQVDFANCKFINETDFKQLVKNGCQPHRGDVLFSKDGTVGKVALIDYDKNFVVLSSLAIVRPERQHIDSAYLKYVMKSPAFLDEAIGKKTGVAIRRIILRNLKDILVPFPPLPEQHRIVHILDEAFDGIATSKANADKNFQNARALFESHLQSVFTQRGEGWVEKTIKEITSHLGDGLHGTPKYTDDGDYYFINGNNLDDGKIVFKKNTKRVSVAEYEKHRKKLTDRTVLVSINGTLGNVAFYNNEKIILGKSACYFNLLDSVDKHFIKYIISSPYYLQYAHREATGATIKNVSLKSMREFKVALPALKEQKTIVRKLDALTKETQRLESIYQQKLAALDALKKSLLDQAFTGQL